MQRAAIILQVFNHVAVALMRHPAPPAVGADFPMGAVPYLVQGSDADAFCYDAAMEYPVATEKPRLPWVTAKLTLVVHRKTGFVLANRAAKCFNKDHEESQVRVIVKKFEDDIGNFEDWQVAVVFARDPFDLVVSDFLYNKIISEEKNTLGDGTAGHHLLLCEKRFSEVAQTLPIAEVNESLRSYMLRVPEDDAIRLTMCQGSYVVEGVVRDSQICTSQKQECMQVGLADFMKDPDSFVQTWQNISEFSNLSMTDEIEACLQKQDVHSHTFEDSLTHCSSSAVSKSEHARIRRKAERLDSQVFGGFYTEAANQIQL